ncbi:MAG: 2-oxoacid:acceptor oxidoreductase family protein [Syntrophobacteraceae bacterium]
MQQRYEIRLSGSGGQGLIIAGIILAEAAGVYEGKHVCQTQSYGPAARGGASKSEIVISDSEIDYPEASKPDLVLAMNQKACDLHCFGLKPDGVLIVDSTLVKQMPQSGVIAIPFTHIARIELDAEMVANIVALGAITGITGIVSLESLKAAIHSRFPKEMEELNTRAVEAGVQAAHRYLQKRDKLKPSSQPYPL